jgi:hypothetical protein
MNVTTNLIDTYLSIVDSPEGSYAFSSDPIADANSDIRSKLLEISKYLVHANECVVNTRNNLEQHLEFLVAKKAATSKVLTVSGQILELDYALVSLNSIYNMLDFQELGV